MVARDHASLRTGEGRNSHGKTENGNVCMMIIPIFIPRLGAETKQLRKDSRYAGDGANASYNKRGYAKEDMWVPELSTMAT